MSLIGLSSIRMHNIEVCKYHAESHSVNAIRGKDHSAKLNLARFDYNYANDWNISARA